MIFEHRNEPLLSRAKFYARVFRHGLFAAGIVGFSLLVGILGYHITEHLSWIDSLVNASMILGGMGPVNELHTTGGKIFASLYALYSGIIFLVSVGIAFAPIFHRFLHRFHLQTEESQEANDE